MIRLDHIGIALAIDYPSDRPVIFSDGSRAALSALFVRALH